MTRNVLSSIVLVLATGGFAVAGALTDTQPDEATQQSRAAGSTEEKSAIVGSSGEPASLTQDETKITPQSNVNAEGAEEELGEAERGTVSQ